MFEQLEVWLRSLVMPEILRPFVFLILAAGIFFLSLLANLLARKYLLRIVTGIVRKTKNKYDDIFLEKRVFSRLSHVAPVIVISVLTPIAFPRETFSVLNDWVNRGVAVYIFIVAGLFCSAFVGALGEIYQRFYSPQYRPVKGYIQAFKIMLILVVSILAVSQILDQSPKLLLSGIGAVTAILLLVFKDTILSFVASINLATNNMVQPGDWITVPKAGADGDVIDVSLTTVKVQNWNKTISYVPIYSLVSEAFTNWRGMTESGGRRIKRALHLDVNSIRFCDGEMLARFEKINLIRDYIEAKKKEIFEERARMGIAEDDPVNARQLTNLGTFRQYMSAYLRNHGLVHPKLTFLVRYLPVTPEGLPLEMYVFSTDQRWAHYEEIQADLLDHFLAILPVFSLRLFQHPSGADFQRLGIPGPNP